MSMICRTCGGTFSGGRVAGICPRCTFGNALGVGAPGASGDALEGYELLSELGRGAMGVVWLARERSLDRLVALKLIAVADPRLRQRLLREGQAAARLRHPNIVAVHAMGGGGDSTYLAMEFVEGGSLDAHLQGKPIDPRSAAGIVSKLADALGHAHEAGLLHRDVKPSNVLLDPEGEPKLADFGMAAPLEGAGDLTAPGTIAGTPAYLAPELAAGSEAASAASDLYSLGGVLYTCLTGRPPFVGTSAAAILAQLPDGEPLAPRLFEPRIPRDLETICLKCLEKSPARRYASAAKLKADLDAFLRGEPIAARPVGRTERLARYCRRRPSLAIATGVAGVLLLTLAVGGPLLALRLARSERAAVEARDQTERAHAATLERLRDSLLARSRATRLAAGVGQRDDALAAATEAAHIRQGLDARDEVIAALARPEIVQGHDFKVSRSTEARIAFDPDHNRYAIEANPGNVDLRRLSDNGLLQAFKGNGVSLWSALNFSPDGRFLAARDGKGNELVWVEGRPAPAFVLAGRPYALTGRYSGYGSPEAFSPDGSTLASAIPGGGVSFHATDDGRELRRIPTEAEVTHLAYSWDGRWLSVGRGLRSAKGDNSMFLRVVEAGDGREVCRIPIDASFQAVTWDPGSDRLLVVGDELTIFRIPDGRRIRRFADPLSIKGFFGPGGGSVIASTSGGLATLWDLGRVRPLITASLGSQGNLAVSRDGSTIVKERGNEGGRIFRLEMSPVVRTLPIVASDMHDNVLSAALPVVDFSPDGRFVATAVWDSVQLRDREGRVLAVAPQGSVANYCTVRFSRDSANLWVCSNELGLVRIPVVPAAGGGATLGPAVAVDPEPGYFVADVSPDGTRVLLTSLFKGKCKVARNDGTASTVRWDLPGAAGGVFLSDGRQVLVNSLEDDHGAHLELRDALTGERGRVLDYAHGAHVHLSPDGATVLFGVGDDKSVILRTADWSKGPELPTSVQGRGNQAAFCPDGRCIAFGEGDKAILVSTADGSILAHLQAPQGGTYLPGLAFSPDGGQLALWWDNGQLTLWNLKVLRMELGKRGLDW